MNDPYKRDMISYTLSRSVFGSELKPTDIEELTTICSLKAFKKNEYLFRQEDPARCFYIVHSGSINIHKLLPDGREQIIHIFRQLDSFGEIALAGTDFYPVSAVAIEDSQVICIESSQLRTLIRRTPDISLRIIASMSLHLKFLVERLEQQKFQQADVRLASWIIGQLPNADADSIQLAIKKKTLAAQLGITSETLSRTLLRFKKEKWIEEDKTQIRILDKPSMLKCQQGQS